LSSKVLVYLHVPGDLERGQVVDNRPLFEGEV
jgi:hypothetical protein